MGYVIEFVIRVVMCFLISAVALLLSSTELTTELFIQQLGIFAAISFFFTVNSAIKNGDL